MSTCYWIWYPGDFELYHATVENQGKKHWMKNTVIIAGSRIKRVGDARDVR